LVSHLDGVDNSSHLIVQGIAYHPRYYRSNFYTPGTPSFGLLVLSKEQVYEGYLRNNQPKKYFSDGSEVLLIGCKIGQDSLWAADRVIVKLELLIQLDHEKKILIDPSAKMDMFRVT
jgi:hypothetical protein